MPTVREGRAAPPFTLPDAKGKDVTLADLRGRDVVVYFYPADDTPGCTKEACGFRDAWSDLRAAGVVVLGISPDPAASHKAFASKYKLPFTLLSDPNRRVMKTYGAWGKKLLYGKEVVGTIRSTVWIGPDGTVKKHWARVADSAKHAAAVLAAIKASKAA
jgi:thioredoxin-dependent peroxiredoxin